MYSKDDNRKLRLSVCQGALRFTVTVAGLPKKTIFFLYMVEEVEYRWRRDEANTSTVDEESSIDPRIFDRMTKTQWNVGPSRLSSLWPETGLSIMVCIRVYKADCKGTTKKTIIHDHDSICCRRVCKTKCCLRGDTPPLSVVVSDEALPIRAKNTIPRPLKDENNRHPQERPVFNWVHSWDFSMMVKRLWSNLW